MTRVLLLSVFAIGTFACGGAIEQPTGDEGPPPVSTLKSSTEDAPPFGTWELVSLDRDEPVRTEVHDIFQMDLRADGTATVRRCGKTYYEPGSVSIRCADASSYDCYYGTVSRDGASWRIELPDLPSAENDAQGLVEYDGDRLKVHYVYPSATAGWFVRTDDAEKFATTSSSTVANCKGR